MEKTRKYLHSKALKQLCRFKQSDFSRNRLLNFPTLIAFFVNLAKRSLQIELSKFMKFANLPDVSKQALSKARKKLSPEAFVLLNNELIKEFYTDNDVKLFNKYRLLAVDGSTIPLPKTDTLMEKYGTCQGHRRNAGPIGRVSTMFDVLNKLTLHAELAPYGTSEKALAKSHLAHLLQVNHSVKDLLLFDRNYPSTELMFILQLYEKDFVMRCSRCVRSEINKAAAAEDADQIVTLAALRTTGKPNKKILKQKLPHLNDESVIDVRVLTCTLKSGEKEILVTSLTDKNQFPAQILFDLYAKRWDIEENYKTYKSILEIENFSGKSELAVQQDFHATVFTSNVVSLLITEAQTEIEEECVGKKFKYKYKVNKNVSVGILKNELINILLSDYDLDVYCEKLKEKIKQNLVPIRPNRSFKRKKNREEGRRHHQNRRRAL